MININHLKADYLFFQFEIYISRIQTTCITWYNHTPLLIPFLVTGTLVIVTLLLLRKAWNLKESLLKKSVFLELTPPAFTDKTAYTTQQLFSVLHNIGSQKTFLDKILGRKIVLSFEIVSTKEKGIRYLIRTTTDEAPILERILMSYLPQVRVKQMNEYLPENLKQKQHTVIEFKLNKHFAFPLAKQDVLNQHDPVAYITGMMTKLFPDELIAFQVIVSPTKTRQTQILSQKILRNEDVLGYLNKPQFPIVHLPVIFIAKIFLLLMQKLTKEVLWAVTELAHGPSRQPLYATYQNQVMQTQTNVRPARVLTMFEQETVTAIHEKMNQSLFEASIRILVVVSSKHDQKERVRGITAAFAPFTVPKYQSLRAIYNFPPVLMDKIRLFTFEKRLLSMFTNASESLLSISEIADLYHFPFTETTKTENIVKALSRELPAPLSLKNNRELAVVFGENTYGGTATAIGLTAEERETHMYIIGRTGSGKTTMMFSMAKNDIENGAGMAFVDPHGDVSEELLDSIPAERIADVIYMNPIDLKYPIGINLLELTPDLDEDEAELEKEVVCEGVVSLFRKVFSKEETANAHRIEYILRNTIHTAFYVENATIFTVYKLLTNPEFQRNVIKTVDNEDLRDFWKNEFGKAGGWQVVKMVSGVTAKVGRFLFSPTAKRILEQEKSTINFDDLMNQGKILICNFSQGNLGEDTARLLGTTILTKIQQAALRRAKLPKHERKPFYLYVDEFQNFATNSFIKMLSEGRKYGLSVTIAEQSTSQQEEQRMVHTILANVTTVVCFRSANPVDEQLMLSQFSPYVEKGDITNLPRYHFYIKISALKPEESFSGKTIYTPVEKDIEKRKKIIDSSRINFASVYVRKPKVQKKSVIKKEIVTKVDTENKQHANPSGPFPETMMKK